MEVRRELELVDVRTGSLIAARIDPLDRETAKLISTGWCDSNWWTNLEGLIGNVNEQPDFHWDWVALVSKVQSKPAWRAVCVRTADRCVQGAMLYKIGVESAIEPSARAVFVDRLATAPFNRSELVHAPVCRGVGFGLLTYAIAESWSYGLKGRTNLIPIAHQDFYQKRGFRATELRCGTGIETLYEIPCDDAQSWLRESGVLA